MRRLFISLYLAVTVGLVFINWSSERIWQEFQQGQRAAKDQESQAMARLLKPYKAWLLNHSNELDTQIQALNRETGLAIQLVPVEHMSFLPEQVERLDTGELAHFFDSEGASLFYQRLDANTLIQYGPINTTPILPAPWFARLLYFASYLGLALIILLWSRPLWRDLKLVQAQAEDFSSGSLSLTNPVTKASVVYPLGQTLERMASRIRDLLQLQKQMTHAVSHDIRTPLARLKFSLAMLPTDEGTESPHVKEMSQDIAEIETLIDEMLTYGRLEANESPLNIESVDIAQLLENLTDKLNRHQANPILLDCPAELSIHCDGHLIERAVQNLLVNAQRHAKSQVILFARKQDAWLKLWVEDDGEGISEQNKSQLFTPFCRLDQSRNKSSGGFGLGLAIVKKIVDWHGGHIQVTSTPGEGARFELTIPPH